VSKFDLPELPSDEELGITDQDRERLEEELPADRPELSKQEMAALLGGASAQKGGGPAGPKKGKKRKEPKKEKEPKEKAEAEAGATARPREAEGPRSRWRGPLTLLILFGLAALSSARAALPRPVPANAGDTVFSSARAMSMLVDIARAPHPTGSPEHTRVRDYLVERLRALGLEPEVQTATGLIRDASAVRTATVRNVIARLPGTASTGAVLVTAHYDTRELSPGAGDDGSGVVAILEALRALRTGEPLRNDVIVLFTDAEELGLLGARSFVDQHPWISDVRLVLSFEMRGGGGPSIMFETNDQNGWVVRALQDFDPEPLTNSLAAEVYARMPNDTDFTPFREAGKQGLNFAALGNAHVYHQSTDTPERVSEATLQHHGLRALAGLRHFGQADLGEVDAPNAVYFTVPVLGLVVYGVGWVLPTTGGLVLLLLLAGLAARRAGARIAGVMTGLGLAILGAALSYGVAFGLTRWVARFHPEAGSLAGSLYHSEGWYVLAMVAATFAVVTALHTVARRWVTLVELVLGATLLPLGLAAWLSVGAPLAAMNLQWPVAAALVSALVLALSGSMSSGIVPWIASLLLAAPVLACLVWLAEVLWLSLTFQTLALVAVLVVITLHLSLAALDSLRHPNGWWAPATGFGAAAAALSIGVASAGSGPESPAPSTLVYAYEHGTGAAYWATDPNADLLLDEEAIAWAEERAGAPFAATEDMTRFGLPWEQAPVAVAPIITAATPEVVIIRDEVEANVRRVTLAARSRIGAERLTFARDRGGRTRFLSVAGAPIEQPGSVEWVDHWGIPDSMVVVELDMPAAEPIAVHLLEDHLRPRELLGADAFSRPPHLAPDVEAVSDRAIFRYSIAAFADPRHAFMQTAGAPGGGAAAETGARPDSLAAVPAPTGGAPEVAPPAGATTDSLAAASDSVALSPSSTSPAPDSAGAASRPPR
jgi:hypothetical protein